VAKQINKVGRRKFVAKGGPLGEWGIDREGKLT
jgi:hypothetical protein